tara:strand:- start:8306 stop:8611 length:306 start_codon:yes stop_codon:yes gene_type:complete
MAEKRTNKKFIVSMASPLGGGRKVLFATGPKHAVAKALEGKKYKGQSGMMPQGSNFIVTQWNTPDGKAMQWMFTNKDFDPRRTFKHTAQQRARARRQFKGR